MEFFTYSDVKRPVRLCEATREFAHASLNHKYGLDTLAFPAVTMDEVPGFDELSPIEKYDAIIREIVTKAPIRICDGELLSGAATLGKAIDHVLPATYQGEPCFSGVSHLTINFETVLKKGIDGIEADVDAALSCTCWDKDRLDFLKSAKHCLAMLRHWHSRYLQDLACKPGYQDNYRNLLNVPLKPATGFYEAVQSIWFIFSFTRLCGNWPGFGRLDWLLGEYLDSDLENGTITLDKAREILAHFFIKGCEWVSGTQIGSGDAQHYQNIVLAGVDENGREVTNHVTYLVLEVLEELPIGDFPTTVRLNHNTPPLLYDRLAETMKHGGGVLAVYNEDEILQSMVRHGYSLKEARSFANDGCWEIQVPGKTYFSYIPFDALSILLNETLGLNKEKPAHFESIETLKHTFFTNLNKKVTEIFEGTRDYRFNRVSQCDWSWTKQTPCTIISLFEEGCIQKAASYFEGGAIYTVVSPHIGGAADVGNSLRVLDKLCFIDKTISFDAFMQVLKSNWEDHEVLRQYVLHKISLYGNDDDRADSYTVEVVDRFADMVLKHKDETPFLFVPGVSTFGRQIEWRCNRPASPHGHKTGDILAPNMGATPGSDLKGATALIKSYCKLDLKNQVTGAALDVKLLPSAVQGEGGKEALIGLLRGFVILGGCFMQPDVIDNSILRDAQEHPENYQSLSVRVSGWNARFVTLNKEWQDMCIQKTEHGSM